MSDPKQEVLDAEAIAKLVKENADLKASLAAATAPAPARKLSAAEAKAVLELKYAQQCRRETPNVTRGGIKFPTRGSGNCADHATNGKES